MLINFTIVLVYDGLLFQALWQLLWVNPLTQPSTGKSVSNNLSKKNPVALIQNRVGVVVAELLSQVIVHFMAMLTVVRITWQRSLFTFSFCHYFYRSCKIGTTGNNSLPRAISKLIQSMNILFPR